MILLPNTECRKESESCPLSIMVKMAVLVRHASAAEHVVYGAGRLRTRAGRDQDDGSS